MSMEFQDDNNEVLNTYYEEIIINGSGNRNKKKCEYVVWRLFNLKDFIYFQNFVFHTGRNRA